MGASSINKITPSSDGQIFLSIVSPVYLGEDMIDLLVNGIVTNVSAITPNFEIILVDDGSPDKSWEKIKKNASKDKRVKGIKLSRNFGQHYAITAGLTEASGDWIVVMDCDLQDRPEEIPNLYRKALEGYDIVQAQRIRRRDSFLKRLSSQIFYAVFRYLTDFKPDNSIANFGIYHNKTIDAVLSMGDQARSLPVLLQWVGFSSTKIPVVHGERHSGKSSYNYIKLFRLAFDIILSFSNKPLRISIGLGLFISIVSFIIGMFYLIRYLRGEVSVPGYTSLIISIWFLSGIIISIIGMVGIYVGKTFDGTKNRPLFIVKRKINTDE